MSTPEISQVLAQMRVMAAKAQGMQPPPQSVGDLSFSDMLKNSIDSVNETQQHANTLKKAFELGDPDVDLARVMIASQKASVSFQAMNQVRNKLVEAYKDVMNMPL